MTMDRQWRRRMYTRAQWVTPLVYSIGCFAAAAVCAGVYNAEIASQIAALLGCIFLTIALNEADRKPRCRVPGCKAHFVDEGTTVHWCGRDGGAKFD